jgi:hypothetical protein
LTRFFFLTYVLACTLQAADPFRPGTDDDLFLEDLGRRSFLYFWENSNPTTGLTLDRARADGSQHPATVASIAATGFALTSYCVAADRGWAKPGDLRERTRITLRFLADRAPGERGWFYHWMDAASGARIWRSELSSIDTALLLGGVLTSRQCFADDGEIVRLAARIYQRVDFPWMLNGDPFLLSHGWRPESGFIPHRWAKYSEHSLLYLLALGAKQPIPSAAWYAWERTPNHYGAYTFVGRAPMLIHQYSQAWVDFRGLRDRSGVDYFENSVTAARAHRQFCIDLAPEFPSYSDHLWGITASDSEQGYVDWGGPPRHARIDGTIVPWAAGGSLMLAPDIALPALRMMRERFGDAVYKRYGFVDAFKPGGWIASDVIGIDVGITLLSAENLRSEGVWKWFMQNSEIRRALDLAGLSPQKIAASGSASGSH